MAISFPSSPTLGQIVTLGQRKWQWDGDRWKALIEPVQVEWTNVANVPSPTINLSGDASGTTGAIPIGDSATLSVTVANDSHTHDGRYYTESEADSRFINTAGDTMTGALTLSGNPTSNLHASTKQYVDTVASGVVGGSVASADKWTTPRAISLSGDVVGSVNIDGSTSVTMVTAVANDSHTHDGRYYTETEVNSLLSANATASNNYTDVAIANLIASAPGTLDTLNELAAALGDDPNFATTVTNSIATKVSKSGDTMTGLLTLSGAPTAANHAATKAYVDSVASGVTGGAVASADKWTTARTITLAGDTSGSVSIDGSSNVTLTVAVADDSHNHTWNNIDGGTVNAWGGLRHSTASGYIDFGPANTSWAHIYTNITTGFYFNAPLTSTGDITAFASDKRLKENVESIDNALNKVLSLNGVTYTWNQTANELAGYDMSKRHVGVFAQDVERVLPEAVAPAPFDVSEGKSASGEEYLTVKYEKMVPLLIEAMKEQQSQIEALKAEIQQLKDK